MTVRTFFGFGLAMMATVICATAGMPEPTRLANGVLIVTGHGLATSTRPKFQELLDESSRILTDVIREALAEKGILSAVYVIKEDDADNALGKRVAETKPDGLLQIAFRSRKDSQPGLIAQLSLLTLKYVEHERTILTDDRSLEKEYVLDMETPLTAVSREFVGHAMVWIAKTTEFSEPSAYRIAAIREMLAAENFEEAYASLMPLHYNGVPEASLLLGMMYARGDHVERDLEKAEFYFSIAAANNDPDAAFVLADMQRAKDATAYALLMERAAGLGHLVAAQQIGLAYFNGEGVPKNLVLACKWLFSIQLRTPVAVETWTEPLRELEASLSEEALTLARVLAWNFVYLDRREGWDQETFERLNPGFNGRIRSDNHVIRDGHLLLIDDDVRKAIE